MSSRLCAVLAAALVAGSVLSGCAADPAATALAPGRVGVAEFATLIAQPGVQIVDVRTPQEFADGHLAGAVNIPFGQYDFTDRVARLDPTATYAVYCRSSKRSHEAVTRMHAAGIAGVYELGGGTIAWTEAGHPLTR